VAQALVLDVKLGSGAFMRTLPEARALAISLVQVAQGAGLPAVALITDMDRLLGHTAGNALELHEAIQFLTGREQEPRLLALTLALGAEALCLAGVAPDLAAATAKLRRALDGGEAAERFARMVVSLGGPADVLSYVPPPAPVQQPVAAPRAGVIKAVDVRALGLAVVTLGGGRRTPSDALDARVGLAQVLAPGREVAAGEALAVVHAADGAAAAVAAQAVMAAYSIGDEAVPQPALLRGRVAA